MSTLTLSGWTQPTDAIAQALELDDAQNFDYSEYPNAQASFAGLRAFESVEHVIGWSMGGQLALRAIAAGILLPQRLTLISTPYRFVRDAHYPHGMDLTTFMTFRNNYARDPKRTASRFHALVAKGDARQKEVMEQLSHHSHATDASRWLPWFDELGRTGLHQLDLKNAPPTLIVHGTEDMIVPVAQSKLLAVALPNARLQQWQGAAHAPHLHDPQRLRALIETHRSEAA